MQCLFLAHTQGSKHFLLQLSLEYPDGSTTDLVTVQYHIIGIGLDLCVGM